MYTLFTDLSARRFANSWSTILSLLSGEAPTSPGNSLAVSLKEDSTIRVTSVMLLTHNLSEFAGSCLSGGLAHPVPLDRRLQSDQLMQIDLRLEFAIRQYVWIRA